MAATNEKEYAEKIAKEFKESYNQIKADSEKIKPGTDKHYSQYGAEAIGIFENELKNDHDMIQALLKRVIKDSYVVGLWLIVVVAMFSITLFKHNSQSILLYAGYAVLLILTITIFSFRFAIQTMFITSCILIGSLLYENDMKSSMIVKLSTLLKQKEKGYKKDDLHTADNPSLN